MGETCAKCGKELSWIERQKQWNSQLKHGFIHYLPAKRKDCPEFTGKKLCYVCMRELVFGKQASERLCLKCGYCTILDHVNAFGDNAWTTQTLRCQKFHMDVGEDEKGHQNRGNEAETCTSFIPKEEYKQKALKGEMEHPKANVQVIFDFSSLRDEMSKDGVVMSAYNCPKCNGMVDIPEAGKVLICKHCGTPIKPVDIFDKIKSLMQ